LLTTTTIGTKHLGSIPLANHNIPDLPDHQPGGGNGHIGVGGAATMMKEMGDIFMAGDNIQLERTGRGGATGAWFAP
jgi:hypothetical protein